MKKALKVGSLLLCMSLLLMAVWAPLGMTALAIEGDETTTTGKAPSETPVQMSLYLSMTMSDDRYVTAMLTDENGDAVAYYPVGMKVDGIDFGSQYTDYDGTVTFGAQMPEDAQKMYCIAPSLTINGIEYIGSSAELKGSAQTAAPTQASTAAPETTKQAAAATTAAAAPAQSTTATTVSASGMLMGPNTTSVLNNQVAVNVNVDMPLLNAFGLQKTVFDTTARMLMDKTVFAQMVGTASGMISLNLLTSGLTVTEQQLSAAKSGLSAYSKYKTENIKSIVMDMSVQYTDSGSGTKITPAVAEYTIELPLPDSMKTAEVVAISRVTATGLSGLEPVAVKNGMLQFSTTQFGTIAVVGFVSDSGKVLGNLTQNPLMLGLLITFGVLLLLGAGALIWFVVLRKKKDGDDPEKKRRKGRRTDPEDDEPEQEEALDEEAPASSEDDSDMKLMPGSIGTAVRDWELPAITPDQPETPVVPENPVASPLQEKPPVITGDEDVDAILREIDEQRKHGGEL